MELTELNTRGTAELQLKHPVTGDDLPGAVLTVYGADSDAFKAAKYALSAGRVTDQSRVDLAQIEADAVVILAACIKSWGDVKINGKTPTDPVAALNEYPWIKPQLDSFIGKRANFIKPA